VNQIYLDVDGVLNPITHKSRHKHWADYKRHHVKVRDHNNLGLWMSMEMGAALLSVAAEHCAEIIWSTTWLDEANEIISPLVGLPNNLRVVPFEYWKDRDEHNCGKIPYIAEFCDDNAIVVIDDCLGFADKCWLNEREYPTLGIKPYDSVGLTKDHIAQVGNFFGSL
jgi:hypothetical protein